MHRRTAKNAALGVDEVTVGRVGIEQLGHLLARAVRAPPRSRARSSRPAPRAAARPAGRAGAGSRRAVRRCAARRRPRARTVSTKNCSPGDSSRSTTTCAPSGRRRSRPTPSCSAFAQLVARDVQHRIRARAGPGCAGATSSDQLLARQRVGERGRGAEPLERERRLRRDRLQQRELVGGERPLRIGRGEDEHADHALVGDHRHPRAAPRTDLRRQARADARRAVDVVDRHGRRIEDGARDARRLAAEVDAHVVPEGRRVRRSARRRRPSRSSPPSVTTTTPAKPTPSRAVTWRTSGRAASTGVRARARAFEMSATVSSSRSRTEARASASRVRPIPPTTRARSRHRASSSAAGISATSDAANENQV